ncbi:MAG: indole-3-glycerol phosphate synthase TrpC [Bacteroidetes bacterium]|nr:indole-3-glycerol phosphate synthase TrpC [Bacteroidota bacterium]
MSQIPMTILEKIVQTKMQEITHIKSQAQPHVHQTKPTPSFRKAIHQSEIQIIAEIKKASPSRGILIENFNPVELAKQYAEGSAAAFSVLTDEHYFQGSLTDLATVCELELKPAIRKDFIIDPVQIEQAFSAGASAVLLIVAILSDRQLKELYKVAHNLKLDVLVEVHTLPELRRSFILENPIIGINNRNLHNFHVDLNVALSLVKHLPADYTKVTESGIFTREDMLKMQDAGFQAALIGESLVKSGDPVKKLKELLGKS